MKLILNKNKLILNPEQLLRRVGYVYIRDRRTGKESFARCLGRGFYPRFHLYLEDQGEQIILNLHLDQKRPIYNGVAAHNAEYDGEAVEMEAERIKNFATINSRIITRQDNETVVDVDLLDKIRPKQFSSTGEKVKKKKWWRFFG
ncbi:MAG: hypothetical protein AAB653_03825 [Patescibacteria group bacterium]